MSALNPRTGEPYSTGRPGTPGGLSLPPGSDRAKAQERSRQEAEEKKKLPKGTVTSGGQPIQMQVGTSGGKPVYVYLTESYIKEQRGKPQQPLSQRQKIQASLLTRQGYRVEQTKQGIRATKGGRQVFITKGGRRVEAPESANVRADIIPSRQVTQFRGRQEQRRRTKEKIRQHKERPAELASRIVGTKEMSAGATELFTRRKAGLLSQAGEEATLAHYPQYEVGAKRPVGRQEGGISPKTLRTVEAGLAFKETVRSKFRLEPNKTEKIFSKTGTFIKSTAEKTISPKIEPKLYKTADEISEFADVYGPLKLTPKGYVTIKGLSKVIEFEGGYIGGLRREPTKVAALTAGFFVLPAFLGTAGAVVKASKVTTYAWGVIEPTAIGIIVGSYSKSIHERAKSSDRYFGKLGEIGSTEITPMAAGGYLGSKFWPKALGYTRTIGREKVETEAVVPMKVIKGKSRFPTAVPKKHLGLFIKKEYVLPGTEKAMMYHATTEKLGLVVGEGTSELPGLYGAHSISPYFTRIGAGYSRLYGGGLLEGVTAPTVAAITPTEFRQRKAVRFDQGYKWFGKDVLGVADVPGVKSEVEAILPPETKLQLTGKRYYFKWKGVRIPIDEYAVGGGVAKGRVNSTKTAEDIYYSYEAPSPSYVFSPGSFLGGSLSSKKYSSGKSSRVSSGVSVSSSRLSSSSKVSSSISRLSSSISKSSRVSSGLSSGLSSAISGSRSYRGSSRTSRTSRGYSYVSRSSGKSSKVSYGVTDKPVTYLFPGSKPIPGKKKRKWEKYGLSGFYNPSLGASADLFTGPTPKILTGITARPIPKVRL